MPALARAMRENGRLMPSSEQYLRNKQLVFPPALAWAPGTALGLPQESLVRAIAGGAVASFGLRRILTQTVPPVPGDNPWLVAGTASLLVGVAGLASWLPARRAAKVDPIIALRAE